jgi:hypothetical protein
MSDKLDFTQGKYRELTITQGPGVDGKAKIKYGRHTRRRRIDEEGNIVVVESVAERVTLPEPMSESEIDEWLQESDAGTELLERYGWDGETA